MSTFKVSTKKDKGSAEVETTLTIDWTGATPDVLKDMATSYLVIKWQGRARKHGIPTAATIKAIDFRPGARTPAPTMAEMVAALTPEQKAELIKKLQG